MGRQPVKAIILAGDHPWDRSPVGRIIPRALLPIAQSPVAAHLLRGLSASGVHSATFCVNPASRVLRRYFADGRRFDVELDYFEDQMPRGPAGCLRDAAVFSRAERFLVVEGSLVADFPYSDILQAHEQSGAPVTIVTGDDPLVSVGPAHLSQPAGVWVIDRGVLGHVPPAGYQDLKEGLIPRLLQANIPVRSHRIDIPIPRVRDARSYYAINEWVVRRHTAGGSHYHDYRRHGQALVHESARVSASARLVGPVIIGPKAVIADDAWIAGPTVIGGSCSVEPRGCVLRSVLWDHAVVGCAATVDGSIVTNWAWVSADEPVVNQIFLPARLHALRFSGELLEVVRECSVAAAAG